MPRQIKSVRAARALLPSGWHNNVVVELARDGKISRVLTEDCAQASPRRRATATSASELDAEILLPAPSNAHSHTFQRSFAGLAENIACATGADGPPGTTGPPTFWTWRETMYRWANRLTPEDVQAFAALAFCEMLESGFAAVAEFHYLHHQPGGEPYVDPAELTWRILAAAEETGIGLTHIPVLYCRGGVRGESLEPEQRRFALEPEAHAALCQRLLEPLRRARADYRLGVAAHSLRAVSREQLATVAAQAAELSAPFHLHIAEQRREVEAVRSAYGASPVAWLLDHFAVDDGWCLVHATHLELLEARRLANTEAVVALCPVTEANLGDGFFPADPYLAAGGRLAFGTDSNVLISLAEELRTFEYGQRLVRQERNVVARCRQPGSAAGAGGALSSGSALFAHACAGGAQALDRHGGAIEVGCWGDLLLLDSNALCFASAETNDQTVLDGWIFTATKPPLRHVLSAGHHVVVDGRHQGRERAERAARASWQRLASST